MAANILNVEGFDPTEWDIRREGRVWSHEEFERRIYQAPGKIDLALSAWREFTEREGKDERIRILPGKRAESASV